MLLSFYCDEPARQGQKAPTPTQSLEPPGAGILDITSYSVLSSVLVLRQHRIHVCIHSRLDSTIIVRGRGRVIKFGNGQTFHFSKPKKMHALERPSQISSFAGFTHKNVFIISHSIYCYHRTTLLTGPRSILLTMR